MAGQSVAPTGNVSGQFSQAVGARAELLETADGLLSELLGKVSGTIEAQQIHVGGLVVGRIRPLRLAQSRCIGCLIENVILHLKGQPYVVGIAGELFDLPGDRTTRQLCRQRRAGLSSAG